ncbi:MAG TPA: hypothetical protein VHV82_08770 [Sporichthyaceae bacterium]|nr:hypothetical protein [Sporichthyaceae bacterium]
MAVMRCVRRVVPRAPGALGLTAALAVLLCACTGTRPASVASPVVPAPAPSTAAGPAGGTTGPSTAPASGPTAAAGAEPTLGSAGDPEQDPARRGYGTVRPVVVDNGGDPTGIVEEITWNSWGGRRALGSGTSWYDPPNTPVAASTAAPVTIEAFDLGSCQGHPAYLKVQWWFPTHGETAESNGPPAIDTCPGATPAAEPTPGGR